jgi:hypothetical protein
LTLGVVVIHVKSSRYELLQPMIQDLIIAIRKVEPGRVIDID